MLIKININKININEITEQWEQKIQLFKNQ
jgi:hypothetical protein